MSFFDDEPDEPTRVTRPARPRRAATARGTAAVPPPDVARRRQFALFGGLAIIALLLILFAKSCSNTRHKNALKDYNREVTSIVQSSDRTVSRQLFDILQQGGDNDTQDVTVAVNQVRLAADRDAERARGLDPPSDVAAAQHDLELVMNLRAEGVKEIGDQMRRAVSNQPGATAAIRRIAGQMQAFLASDVVYSQRVNPLIRQALADKDLGDQTVATSKFLPSIGWLDPTQVGDRINPDADTSSPTSSGALKPGTHGHGLIGVTAGGVSLKAGGAVNRVTAKAPLAVQVTYANQGENDESNVTISVRVTSTGTKAISSTKRLNQTKAGTQAVVPIQLTSVPPKGTSSTMTVKINPVRGEQKTDNNSATYTILFQ
ncbi:MAG TPA: hypothetical protein VNT55_00185 [Baekduia sp.]|nr:hypothetical protein [Baekduia sp.]